MLSLVAFCVSGLAKFQRGRWLWPMAKCPSVGTATASPEHGQGWCCRKMRKWRVSSPEFESATSSIFSDYMCDYFGVRKGVWLFKRDSLGISTEYVSIVSIHHVFHNSLTPRWVKHKDHQPVGRGQDDFEWHSRHDVRAGEAAGQTTDHFTHKRPVKQESLSRTRNPNESQR